ncbi:hypothetical protein WCLP8_3960004 [uncultured Gammaproteobacteria bacterium]
MMTLLDSLSKSFGRLVFTLAMALVLGACQTGSMDSRLEEAVADAAREAEINHDYAGAVTRYLTLYETNRDDLNLILALARNLRYAGRIHDARTLLDDSLSRFGPLTPLLTEQGKVDITSGRAELAAQTLVLAKSQDPKDWQPPAVLAVAYDRLGRYDEAAANYRQSLEINPTNAETLNNYALSRGLAGDLPEALKLARQAVAMPGTTQRIRDNLALLEGLVPLASSRPLIPNRLPMPDVVSMPSSRPAVADSRPPRPPRSRLSQP